MKSALELAMEKTEAIGKKAKEELEKLSPAQRAEIEKTRKLYEGKIAEREVMFRQELEKLSGGLPLERFESQLPPEARAPIDAIRNKHRQEREALEAERDEKIEEIKKKGSKS